MREVLVSQLTEEILEAQRVYVICPKPQSWAETELGLMLLDPPSAIPVVPINIWLDIEEKRE